MPSPGKQATQPNLCLRNEGRMEMNPKDLSGKVAIVTGAQKPAMPGSGRITADSAIPMPPCRRNGDHRRTRT